MSKIQVGQEAPDFELTGARGRRFSLAEARTRGPVVAAFFKTSCPVCQFTFPFLERLFRAYGGDRVTFLAISQDDPEATQEFCEEYGVTFPAVSDEEGYPVSNEYGLTNVPTGSLVSPEGKVPVANVGFVKAGLEKISSLLAHFLGRPGAPVFQPGEIIPGYKPG